MDDLIYIYRFTGMESNHRDCPRGYKLHIVYFYRLVILEWLEI